MKKFVVLVFTILYALSVNAQFTAREYLKFGKAKYDDEKYFEAVDFLDKAIIQDPAYMNAIYLRGLSFQQIDQHKLAIADFTTVIDKIMTLDASAAEYFLNRAKSQSIIRNFDKAEEDFALAVQLKPLYPEAYYELAIHRFNTLKDKNEAIRALDLAIQYDPENGTYFVKRAEFKAYIAKYSFDSDKIYESAVRDLTFAIDLEPNNFDYYLQRSQYNKERGEPLQAIEDYDKMIEISPYRIEGYTERGIIKMQNDKYQSAIEDFSKSIELKPQIEQNYRYRALCRHNTQDFSGAYDDYSESIKLLSIDYQKMPADLQLKRLLADTYLKRGAAATTVGSSISACSDFKMAYKLGSRIGYNYLRKYCGI